MINAVKDVSVLSTIAEKDIVKLLKKFIYSICCGVDESVIKGDMVTAVDIGIGVLYIKHEPNSEIEYKFIPCKYLEKGIISTITEGKNPLEEDVNNSLVKKFTNVYKDLC